MPHSAPAPFGIVFFALGLLLAMAAERRAAWAEARDHLRTILRRLEPDHAEAPAIRARLDAAERALGRPAPRCDPAAGSALLRPARVLSNLPTLYHARHPSRTR